MSDLMYQVTKVGSDFVLYETCSRDMAGVMAKSYEANSGPDVKFQVATAYRPPAIQEPNKDIDKFKTACSRVVVIMNQLSVAFEAMQEAAKFIETPTTREDK